MSKIKMKTFNLDKLPERSVNVRPDTILALSPMSGYHGGVVEQYVHNFMNIFNVDRLMVVFPGGITEYYKENRGEKI